MSYKDNWILNLDKLNNSEWILKLISLSNNKNLNKYLDANKDLLYYSNSMFYKSIKNKILEMINRDPIDLISDLVKLRNETEEEISYLNIFLSKYDENLLHKIVRGLKIDEKIELINYGLLIKSSINMINFNKKITDDILNISNSQHISVIEKKSLLESIRSGTGWFLIDYKKHALGTLSDIIGLALNIIQYGNSTNNDKKKKSIKFIVDIFKVYFKDDDLEELILNIFFSKFSFEIPIWRRNFKTIGKQLVEIGGNEKEYNVIYVLNNLLNEFNLSVENGASESIVILFYSIFENIIFKYKALYNEIYYRINQSSFDEKQKKHIKYSVKQSINSLENLIKEHIQYYFNITNNTSKFGFEKTSNVELYPDTINKNAISSKNIYRIIGGIESIHKKENCLIKNFPIKILYKSSGDINGIEIEESKERIIDIFIKNKTNYSMGGFVMQPNIYLKSFNILKKYLNNVVKSKLDSIKLIDNEFKKMIKGIKLNKIAVLSKKIQEDYKKIILQKDIKLKQNILEEILHKYVSQYKKKQDELLEIISDIKEESKILKRSRVNVDKNKENMLKKISHHHKILTNKYFVIKNYNYVFKLLTIKIYESMQHVYRNKLNKNIEIILPNIFIKRLEEEFKDVDNNFESKKDNLTVSNLDKISKSIGGKSNIHNWLEKHKVENHIIKKKERPLNVIRKESLVNKNNKSLNIEYWEQLNKKLLNKSIYMIFTEYNRSDKGIFDLLYGTLEGELNKSSKFLLSINKKILLEKISHDGFIIICSKKDDISNPLKWRLLKKRTINNLKNTTATKIRKKIYKIILSENEYMKNTYVWSKNILSKEKIELLKLCKLFNNNINNCEVLISREELIQYM